MLKSGVFCQYWLGVISAALSQTSRGQRIKRERLGNRLGWLQTRHIRLVLFVLFERELTVQFVYLVVDNQREQRQKSFQAHIIG